MFFSKTSASCLETEAGVASIPAAHTGETAVHSAIAQATRNRVLTKNSGLGDMRRFRSRPTNKGNTAIKIACQVKRVKSQTNGTSRALVNADAKVLAESGEPMTTKQIIEAMAATNYWTSPGGATPHATINSALLRETNTKGNDARFVKLERGKFAVKT